MRQDDDAGLIRLRLSDVAQLFDAASPSPFDGRSLNRDADEHITGLARELPKRSPLRIVVDLPRIKVASGDARSLPDDMAQYFGRRADQVGTDLRDLFRVGRKSLVIGLAVLSACLAATQAFPGTGVVRESLVILGWVAAWRPIEIFLYEWWPIARRRDLYRRLASATIEIRACDA